MKDKSVESRIVGAMLGLACGDALGAPAEFKDKAYVQQKWGILTEMVGGGMWEPGEWTDDTGMTLCLAEGILSDPQDPVEGTGKRFLEWRKTAKDVGMTISAALSAYSHQKDWPAAARSTPQAKQGKAAGNGSLMRTLPVALSYGADKNAMINIAARQSAMTHWDSEAETGCIVYCLWVNYLLAGQTLRDAWHRALKEGRSIAAKRSETPDMVGGKSTLESGFWKRLEVVETLTYEQLQPSGYAGYVIECLEAAAWCCLHSDSLEEALVKAVNLAGEADTIAAVAGGIAGAYWGEEAIPARWLDKLHKRAELEQTAKRLAGLRRHIEVYATEDLPALNYDWVAERIMAGRNPLTARDVDTLKALGITHILDLREPREWAAPKFGAEALAEIERCGLHRTVMTVLDMKAPTAEALEAACRYFDETLQDGGNRIYIHCRAGMERTAAVLIAYHARRHGVSYDEALAKLREGRPIFKPMPGQERAVRQWLEKA